MASDIPMVDNNANCNPYAGALHLGLLGIGVQKSLRAEVQPDNLVVDTGVAADDGLTILRQQACKKTRLARACRLTCWVVPSTLFSEGRGATSKSAKRPFFMGAGGLL